MIYTGWFQWGGSIVGSVANEPYIMSSSFTAIALRINVVSFWDEMKTSY